MSAKAKGLSADVTSGQFRANSSAVGRQWRKLTYRLQDQGEATEIKQIEGPPPDI